MRAIPLVAILSLALFLRLWGLRFGLPYAYHVDEPTYVSAALNLGAGIIGKQANPTGFSNILFGEYAFYFVLGKAVGIFASAADFESAYRSDPSLFLLLGRLTSALLGAGNILAVYLLGRAIRNGLTGLVGAGLLAVAFLHVRDSHYGVPDVAATLFVTTAVGYAILALQQRLLRHLVIAAAAAALAIVTKWSVWQVLLPVSLATAWTVLNDASRTRAQSTRWLLVVGVAFVGSLLAGGFQLLLQPATYVEYALREARSGAAGGFGFWQIDTVPGWIFYLKTLGYGLGVAFGLLALLGLARRVVVLIRGRDRVSFLLLIFPLTYFVFMGATRHYFARYALPLVPFAALFAAEAILWLADGVERRNRRLVPAAAIVLLLIVIAQPLSSSIRHDILLTRMDTRTMAKQWIETNLPEGLRVALDWQTHGPPLATPEQNVPGASRSFDVLVVGGTGLSEHPVSWYRDHGFDYLVTSSFVSEIPLVFPDQNETRRGFYASLPRELELIQTFSPAENGRDVPFIFDEIYGSAVSLWERERPGPTVRVFRINDTSLRSER